ncbi:MAG: hypothetical protein WC947_00490 [Elusimicrobiota bacterium]
MIIKKRNFLFLFVLVPWILFRLKISAFGWNAVLPDTHGPLAQQSISLLSELGEYPDIVKFSNDIVNGSNGFDAESAHTTPMGANVKDLKDLWEIKILKNLYEEQYKFSGEKIGVYYYMGNICHLTQDQAVPPHAVNIPHGSLTDNFEFLGGKNIDLRKRGQVQFL